MLNRRHFLAAMSAASPLDAAPTPEFKLIDITRQAGIQFTHNSGAFGSKYLPETLGAGCAFLDYDNDGWQDILLVNGMDWPERTRRRTTLALYKNNRDGTFRDVTREAGLDIPIYGLGVAVGDFNNDGFPDVFISAVGQSRLFQNTGRGTFIDITEASGLGKRQGFSTSAMWLDYDRDGFLDLFVCNYVRWSPDQDIACSLDGKQKSYCTPEAYRGATCWLFRNLGGGRFKDVTAGSGIFDTSSKSLGVTVLDIDNDGWPDIFVANDTQPNKLYRNGRDGKFQEIGVRAGVAFSEDGKARAGMGVDVADLDNTGIPTLAVTNFHNEMLALYKGRSGGLFEDLAPGSEIGRVTRGSLGFGCFFFDANLDGQQDLLVVNGHIDNTIRNTQYAQPPHLFLNTGGAFRDVAAEASAAFVAPKVGRGAAFGDIDNDGDLDVLITTNNGPAHLYRNDRTSGNNGIRFRLIGTESNRDAIGSSVRIEYGGGRSTSKTVKSGGSYLSQSELPLTFGLGKHDLVDRVVVRWSRGRNEEFRKLRPGRYRIVEGKGISPEKT